MDHIKALEQVITILEYFSKYSIKIIQNEFKF